MSRFTTAALAACALFTATAAQAEIRLLDRQIVSKNGTPLGTLYVVVDTAPGVQDDVFVVMEGSLAFPPPMDFVVLAPQQVGGEVDGDAPLRQVNDWQLREDRVLHKAVDDGDCGTIYRSLYTVSEVTAVDGIYRPLNDFVALMGEQNACAHEGRLRWFVDSAELPPNAREMPTVDLVSVDLYFARIDEFGPVMAEADWYSRSWLAPQSAE